MDEEKYGNETDGRKKPSVMKRIFKTAAIAIIVGVYAVFCVRFFVSCDSQIADEILKTPAIAAAHEANPDGFEIQNYEITDWYKSKNRGGEEGDGGGKLLSVSELYYIPETDNLQVTVKFNLDILKIRDIKYSSESLPFKIYLEDEEQNKYYDYSAVKYDERYSFGYIRICFDGIELEKNDGSVDEDGDPLRKSYEMYLHMINADGEYDEKVYDQFSIYTGKKYYKTVKYK